MTAIRTLKNSLCAGVTLVTLLSCKAAPENNFDGAAMDALLKTAVESGEVIGASALVFDDGKTVYRSAFGLRDRERTQPMELDTVVRIYSMTKPITSALIMDLWEDDLLDLDDPVSKFIPEMANMQVVSLGADGKPVFTPQADPMTVKDLLSHTAGIGYGIFGPVNGAEAMYEKADLFSPGEDLAVKMQKLSKLPLIAQPGEGWYYSYSMDVLGRVAEIASGEKLSDLMQARLFDPLKMTETGFYVKPAQAPRFASNYARTDKGLVLQDDGQTSPFLTKPKFESGGGGLVSTLDDYGRFAQMLLQKGKFDGKQILETKTAEIMMSDQLDPSVKFMMPWVGAEDQTGFGFGGRVVTSETEEGVKNNGYVTGLYGWGGMAKTNFHVNPNNGAYGVIMLQVFTKDEPPVLNSFRALVTEQVAD